MKRRRFLAAAIAAVTATPAAQAVRSFGVAEATYLEPMGFFVGGHIWGDAIGSAIGPIQAAPDLHGPRIVDCDPAARSVFDGPEFRDIHQLNELLREQYRELLRFIAAKTGAIAGSV